MSLRDEMDRMFNEFFGTLPERLETTEGVWYPSVDVSETDDDLIVTAELPGIEKDNVKVSVHDNTLTIKGEKKQEKETKNETYHRIERCYGAFQRSITLPTGVDTGKIQATFKNGVLKVKLPKREEAKVKEIPVRVE